MWSETQPKNGRVTPLRTRSNDRAKGRAAIVRPNRDTGTLATLKSTAIGPSCAVAISPPMASIVIITYKTQNAGVFSTSSGAKSRLDC